MTAAERRLALLLVAGPQDSAQLATALYGSPQKAGSAEAVGNRMAAAGYVRQASWDGRRSTWALTDAGRACLA